MAEDLIRYDLLAQDALRSVVRRVLQDAAKYGLPGDHHFFITFDTNAAGVKLSPRLREQYPEDMTIVLQHQFWDLIVRDEDFEVGLSFNKIPEKIGIPYTAIKAFFDPSVQFGLQFELIDEEDLLPAAPTQAVIEELPTAKAKAKPKPKEKAEEKDSTPVAMPKRKEKSKVPSSKKKAEEDSDAPRPSAEIVSLDRFRKKTD